jgi:Holliday junction resolvase
MSNANKNKGKSYERQLCKHLSKVFGFNFERVPNSGAFIGGKNQLRAQKLTQSQLLISSGDIITPDELAHVDFECKFYKDFSFSSMFDNCELLNSWISQAEHTTKKLWFLCFKINHKGEFVVFDRKHTLLYDTIENYLLYKNKYIVAGINNFFEVNQLNIINNNII